MRTRTSVHCNGPELMMCAVAGEEVTAVVTDAADAAACLLTYLKHTQKRKTGTRLATRREIKEKMSSNFFSFDFSFNLFVFWVLNFLNFVLTCQQLPHTFLLICIVCTPRY